MRKIQLGLIGCGMIGQSFIQNALQNPYFEFRGYYDRNASSQKSVQKLAPHARLFSSQEELIRSSDIEALVICTRHIDHAKQAIEGITCGKHILIEKPIATSIEDLSLLLKAQQERPECVVTALPHGQEPILEEAKSWVQEPYLGKLVAFHSYIDVPGPPRSNWYYSASAIGGASLDTLPYALTRLLFFLKCNVKYAVGFKNQLIRNRACLDGNTIETEVDDNASLILELVEGQQAIIRSSWNLSYPEDYLLVRGRKGDLWIDCWKHSLILISDIPPPHSNYAETVWQNRKAYQCQFPSVNSEELKLNLFHEHIKKGKGNLFEVAYGMNILLKCLFTPENAFSVSPFYRQENAFTHLTMGNNYI